MPLLAKILFIMLPIASNLKIFNWFAEMYYINDIDKQHNDLSFIYFK